MGKGCINLKMGINIQVNGIIINLMVKVRMKQKIKYIQVSGKMAFLKK